MTNLTHKQAIALQEDAVINHYANGDVEAVGPWGMFVRLNYMGQEVNTNLKEDSDLYTVLYNTAAAAM